MSLTNKYLRITGAIFVLIFGWGVVAPPLFSAAIDLAVILSIAVVIATPVLAYYLVKPIINQIK